MWTRSQGVVQAGTQRVHPSVLTAKDTGRTFDLDAAMFGAVTRKSRAALRKLNEHGHNALHIAVAQDNAAFFKWAVARVPELLDDDDKWGLKPLHVGAYVPACGVLSAVAARTDAESLLRRSDAYGASVTHHVAVADNVAVLRVIARAGEGARRSLAAPACNDKAWPPIIYATLAGATGAVMELASVPGITACTTVEGDSFLHIACSTGSLTVMERMLSNEHVALWERRNNAGLTPAMMACVGGHARAVMLVCGCKIPAVRETLLAQDSRGWDGALMAAQRDHVDVLSALHCQGCPFDRMLMRIVSCDRGRTRVAHVAAQFGSVRVLQFLYGLGGLFRRSLHENDRRALLLAVRNSKLEVLEFFDCRFPGSMWRSLTAGGLTAAHIAARDGQLEVLAWMGRHAAAHQLLTRPDHMGYMPAHWAAEHDSSEALRVLAGVDRALITSYGSSTPMHVAVTAGAAMAVEWIIAFMRPEEVRAAQQRSGATGMLPYEIALINAVTHAHVTSERIFRALWNSPWSDGNTHEALLSIPIPGDVINRLAEIDEETLDDLPAAVRASLVVRSERVDVSGGLTILADRREPLASLSQLDEVRESALQPCMLDVHFAGEAAAGDGLRREWMAMVAQGLAERSGALEQRGAVYHVARDARGVEAECALRRLGQLIVASVVHSEPLGVPIATALVKAALGYERSRDDAQELDPDGYRNQIEWVADCPPSEWEAAGLELTFVDEQDGCALEPAGKGRTVRTATDRARYAYKLAMHRAYGFAGDMIGALANGGRVLGSALPVLRGLVDPDEIVQLVRGAPQVSRRDLLAHGAVLPPLHPKAGPMKWLLDWLGADERARCAWLLRFATGCASPPAGGLRFLMGYRGRPQPLTFCEGPTRGGGPGLPAAATCLNRVFVPPHATAADMHRALDAAVACGGGEAGFDEGAVDTAAWGEHAQP